MKRRKWPILVLLLMMGGSALAGGISVTGQVKKHDGTNAAANIAVECWDGSISPKAAAPYASGGTLSPTPPNPVTTLSDGTLTNGQTGGFYDPRSNVNVTVKAWENSPGALWYGYGSYSIGDVNAPPAYATVNITTDYKAAAPAAPALTAGGYSLAWDDPSQKYLVSFTLTVQPGSAYKSEGVTYSLEVKKSADDWSVAQKGSGSSWTLVEKNLANPYFVSGGTYTARATATDIWGSTVGSVVTFTIPTGGISGATGAASDETTVSFLKKSGSFGINTFALPFRTTYDAGGHAIVTLNDLVATLNASLGGTGYVATAGYWDEANQLEVGYTFNNQGAVLDKINTAQTPNLVALALGKGYQLSLTGNVSVKFRNYQ